MGVSQHEKHPPSGFNRPNTLRGAGPYRFNSAVLNSAVPHNPLLLISQIDDQTGKYFPQRY